MKRFLPSMVAVLICLGLGGCRSNLHLFGLALGPYTEYLYPCCLKAEPGDAPIKGEIRRAARGSATANVERTVELYFETTDEGFRVLGIHPLTGREFLLDISNGQIQKEEYGPLISPATVREMIFDSALLLSSRAADCSDGSCRFDTSNGALNAVCAEQPSASGHEFIISFPGRSFSGSLSFTLPSAQAAILRSCFPQS
jgi:hypothetical protein